MLSEKDKLEIETLPSSARLLKDDDDITIILTNNDYGDVHAHAHGDVAHPINTSSIVPPSNSATLRMGSI